MFKRESEQPVKVSFEEKKEKRTRRSLRERLSNIPLRRRVEAVLLAVVTIMASLSIDWSSLVARAANEDYIQSGQSISTVFTPLGVSASDTTTLDKAKISVEIESVDKEVDYTYKVYQNLKNKANPESGVEVKVVPEGETQSGTIKYDANNSSHFEYLEINLTNVVLLGDETAAVVFTLTSRDGREITFKTFDNTGVRYVKSSGNWSVRNSGTCIEYPPAETPGTLTNVTLSGAPEKIALTAGQSYSFSEISWAPDYQRKLTLSKGGTNPDLIQDDLEYPTFKVVEDVGDGGKATVTVKGEGISSKEIPINVVSFKMNGPEGNDSTFTYNGDKFTAKDLYTAKCGNGDPIDVAENFETIFSATPKNAGTYTMTVSGQEDSDYEGLVYSKEFTIEPKKLTIEMFSTATVTVEDVETPTISGAKDGATLRQGVHFKVKDVQAVPGADKVTYTITVEGLNNYTGDVTLEPVEATGNLKFDSVVDHVRFRSTEGIYNAKEQGADIVFCDSNDQEIKNGDVSVFQEGVNYYVTYSGTVRGSGAEVKDAEKIVDAGEYTATVHGMGKYTGSSKNVIGSYVLKPIGLTTGTTGNTTVELKQYYYEYSSTLDITPEIDKVTYTGSNGEIRGLAAERDYVLKNDTYARDIGDHNVTISGIGNYDGEATAKYHVFASLLGSTSVELSTPEEGTVTDGSMKAEKTAEWDYVWTHNQPYTYTGKKIKPGFRVRVNDDYVSVGAGSENMSESEGVNNTYVTTEGSKAYFILTLPAKYASKKIKVEFEIKAKPLPVNALAFDGDNLEKDYAYGEAIFLDDGEYYVADGNSTLEEDRDYTISYKDNKNAGMATITATGKGNYSGTSSNFFRILPVNVNKNNSMVTIEIMAQKLDTSGTEITNMNDVVITVKDSNGKKHNPFTSDDFTLSGYKNNKKAWVGGNAAEQPQVTLTGKNNLTGSREVKFEILKESLSGLRWELSDNPTIYGYLGSPGTTVNLTSEKGYELDYAPKMGGKTISLFYPNGSKFDGGNYTCMSKSPLEAGENTITISGKDNYDGGIYYFTFNVNKLDISKANPNCIFEESESINGALPTLTLSYDGTVLKEGTDYEKTVDPPPNGGSTYPAGEYGVTFTAKTTSSYTGTRTETFHIGKPFDKDHVFITMVGPVGTKRTNSGENRLTYFGNNDPYFILTSDKANAVKSKITGPSYTNGTYDDNSGDYSVTFASNSSDRHDVNSTVTVTFKAREEGNTWYNPEGSDGIKYEYKVWPGAPANVGENYGNLAAGLSIYTNVGTPNSEKPEGFNPKDDGYGAINFQDFEYNYTTEEIDPDIHIQYDPSKVGKTYLYASEINTEAGKPAIGNDEIKYSSELIDVEFNNQRFFNATKEKISAKDPVAGRVIKITPASGGWLTSTSPSLQVYYTFKNAKLSDATIAPKEKEYTYSGAPVNLNYTVTIGNSTTLTLGADYEADYKVVGYYKETAELKTIIDNAIKTPSSIKDDNLSQFGTNLGTTPPTNVGKYVFVIGSAAGSHYDGYNIARFSIVHADFTAALKDSAEPVLYGDNSRKAPDEGDLVVTGLGGKLSYQTPGSTNDGYTIVQDETQDFIPRTDARIYVEGTGGYSGCKIPVYYSIFAKISPVSGDYDFSKANLRLESHINDSSCLGLTLKNTGEVPCIGSTTESFDLSTLTLTDGNGVTIPNNYLTATVVGIDSEDNLTTVGKKMITVSGASGKPVTGSRYYYVEVFADLSTAGLELRVNGKAYPGDQIPYTGAAITVVPGVTFRGAPVNINCYSIEGDNQTAIGNYNIKVKGAESEIGIGKYYKGTAQKPYSIVYDLENDVEVVYKTKEGDDWQTLAGKTFGYTGKSIVDNLVKQKWIKVRMAKTKEDLPYSAYTLKYENDIEPGAGTASVTIDPVSTSSINRQVVYFSIGGTELKEGDNCIVALNPTPTVYTYDGEAKEPVVSVTYDQRQLARGLDFEVEYLNNVNVPPENATDSQKPTVRIYGINGRFNGSIKKTFEIKKKELTDSDVSVDISDVPFGGKRSDNTRIVVEPATTVTVGGKTLKKGTDYELIYPDDMNADKYLRKEAGDEYIITVKGIGNYTGEVTDEHVVQLAGTLKGVNIDTSNVSPAYDGKNKKARLLNGLVVKNGECILVKDTDYTIEDPGDIIDAKSYKITITAVARGDYDNGGEGSEESFTYTVTPRSVEENSGEFSLTLYDPVTGNSANSFAWDNNTQIKPKVRLADTRITGHDQSVGDIWTDVDSLKQSIMMNSFTVTYGDNRFAGKDTGSVTLTASGNYKGSITRTFSIGTDIANATLSYDKTSAEYDGTPKSQEITVRYNNNTLEAGVAYESPITYTYTDSEGNVQETTSPSAVGTYVPVIKGKTDGGYYGELKGSPFRIIAQNKTGNIKIKFNGVGGEVDAADYVCHYNTKKQEPSISVYDTSGGTDVALTENVDYTVSYGNNTNAGSGYVYVALKGNYTGTAQEIFTIQPYDISNATLEFTEGENGIIKNAPEASFPYSPLFKLMGTDDNGEQFVISYADSRQKQDLSIPDSSKVKKPGKGSLAVSGTGNNLYGTTNAYDYEVYGRLSEKNVIVTPPINTGVKKDPEVKVVFAGETLVLDTDYSLRIVPFDQTVSGGGNVIVEGLGYFTGSVYTKYGEASDVSSLSLRGFSQQYIYSGVFAGPQESAIYAVDKDGNTVISADKLECTFTSDKDNAACITANATVTITTKATLEDGTVQDGPKATYKIVPRNINSCDIMRLENDIYTGKALKPPVAVSFRRKEYTFGSTGGIAEEKVLDVITLKEGTDYSLSYKNNVYPGTADITVTGKGNYTGTRLFHFVINVISMGSVNAKRTSDGIVVSWAARPYVAGYRVLYDTEKLTAVSTTGTTVTLKDALPTRVGVQPYILGSGKTPIYGAAKYIDVS